MSFALLGYRALRKICDCIPPGAAKVVLNGLSWLYWKLDFKNGGHVLANLQILNRDSTKNLIATQREVYRHFAYFFYEFFSRQPSCVQQGNELKGQIFGHLGLPGESAGLLLVSHTGNWEASLRQLLQLGYSVTTVVMPHSHADVNDFFKQLRHHDRLETVSLADGLSACAQAIKNKRIIALACERDYTGSGLSLPLFGHSISFPKGPAWLMLRYGVPTFLVKSHRTDLLHFSIELEPILLPSQLSGSPSEKLSWVSEHIVSVLFKHILLHTEQWITFDPIFKKISPH